MIKMLLFLQTKARTVEEHFNILGEVGNQAAERAMQRRQQLLAEQEQWLSGEQMFKASPALSLSDSL